MYLHVCAFPSCLTVAAFFVLTSVSRGTVFDMGPSMEKYLPRYDLYYNLSKINECLWDISAQYSDVLSVKMGYRSRLGLAQYVLHINNFLRDEDIHNSNRSRILLSYGEHAAELFPVQSMFHLLQNITQGYNLPLGTYGRNFTEFVLNNIDLYIVTIVNPDGRTVVETTRNYCWIGTASNVDLNSPLQVSSENKDKVRIVAEPECNVIRDLTSHQRFDALISFHSGDRKIHFPNHGKNSKGDESQNADVFYLASILSSLINFDVSLVPVNNSVGGESIFAYASQEKKIPFTFRLGLWSSGDEQRKRPTTECFGFYNPPSKTLQTELLAIHSIYPAIFKYISKWKKLQNFKGAEKNERLKESQARTSHSTIVFFVLVGCTGVYLICNLHVPSTWKMFYRRQRRIVSLRTLGTVFSIVSVL